MHFPILMFVLTLIQSEVVFSYTGNYFIEFNLQGADLPYTTTPPDAYCLVKLRLGSGQYNEIGRTAIIKSSYNPIWSEMFKVDYELGDYKSLKVEVWHKDFPRPDDFLGSFTVDVNELASASNYAVSTDFYKEDYFIFDNRGSIILRHRIYKVEGGRRHFSAESSSSGKEEDHSPSFPYILVALSLYYFLQQH